MRYITEKQEVPVLGGYDVIVCGGGVAGCAAALEAARHGKSVMIIEKSLMLGGLGTLGLIDFFVPMCNGRGKAIIKGMGEELLRDSIRYSYDTLSEEWKNGEPGHYTEDRYMTRYSAFIFAIVLMDKLKNAGVEILFDTVVAKPVMNGGHCEGVIVENKTGRGLYTAGTVVDATGDADILFRAGVPTVQGKNYFTYGVRTIDMEHIRQALEKGDIRLAYSSMNSGKTDLYGHGQPSDIGLIDGVTAEEVTEYITRNQTMLLDILKYQDRFSRDITVMPGMPQFRTTRRLSGDATLTEDDVYRHFDDSVCVLNDFDHRDGLYELPYHTLVRSGYDNLITCGRSVSASGWAWDVTRVIPPAILSGQAAGLAACLRKDEGCAIGDINVERLQGILSDENMMIHFDDALVPEDRTVVRAPTDGHM